MPVSQSYYLNSFRIFVKLSKDNGATKSEKSGYIFNTWLLHK